MRLAVLSVVTLISGCSSGFTTLPYLLVQENLEINELSDEERCDRIHIDMRKQCREKLDKKRRQTEEMAKAMKKKY